MKKQVSTLMVFMSLLFLTMNVSANDRYISYDGQGIWASDPSSSSPAVEVSIKGKAIYAKFIDGNNFPAIRLKRFNSNLLNEYTEQFIKLEDYNNDGYLDIAVLKSAGYGGSNLCYSVFNFRPEFFSYDSHAKNTVCEE